MSVRTDETGGFDAETALQARVWRIVRDRFEVGEREAGLTQAVLARRMGVRRGQVSIWLRTPERMTLRAAARLLRAMGAELACEARPFGEQAEA